MNETATNYSNSLDVLSIYQYIDGGRSRQSKPLVSLIMVVHDNKIVCEGFFTWSSGHFRRRKDRRLANHPSPEMAGALHTHTKIVVLHLPVDSFFFCGTFPLPPPDPPALVLEEEVVVCDVVRESLLHI